MRCDELIRKLVLEGTVDYAAAASLASARSFVAQQGGSFLADFPVAVSLGIVLPNDVVDLLPRRNERAVQVSYRTHAYGIVNQRLDLAASELASTLQKEGCRAFPVAASERVDDERLCGIFSHKLAASLGGLGWIGKNCLLITPQHGPRVRWATVLTDAPFEVGGKPVADGCGGCSKCVEICPARAFTGRGFDPEEPRELRYEAKKCDQYFRTLEKSGNLPVCGMCLYVCPYGKVSATEDSF